MRGFFLTAACAALTAAILLPSPSLATKTVKQCQDEWRANKADNVAKGIKRKGLRHPVPRSAHACCCAQSGVGPHSPRRPKDWKDCEGVRRRMDREQGRK